MNFESVLMGPGGVMLLVAVVVLVVNACSYGYYNEVRNLVGRALQEHGGVAGDETTALYTKLLYGEVMRGSFFTPTTVVSGNPANDRVYRAVERSQEFGSVRTRANWLRNLPPPLHLVPYCV